jgi:hypothetical protein
LDLIELGTRAATAALPPLALDVAAEVDEAAVELLAAADVVGEVVLLLLPHPTIATALSNEIATESQLFRVRIALLLVIRIRASGLAEDMQHRV